ncbi:glycosyltransferase family 4 protein [Jannaschia sp. LMIT008]|uniref:glycosyltransferase family 4 protein n=1 Tax=Jannaschia maritima TaxID=3032585 RepID=UPI00281249D7|nr:glycosyltransferase family 4 protein [Jannaschia sp. LMIT008]
MKILVVVSEFPKVTETFAYRNLVAYGRLGHDPWLFHVKTRRRDMDVHEFFRPLEPKAFGYAWLGSTALAALLGECARAPLAMATLIGQLARAHWREPKRGLAVAALFPKSVALGRWCRRTGVDHIHGEFAGHPATSAMIASRVAGLPYSFTAHANDIFISQAMLVEKAARARFVRSISRFNIRYLSRLPGFPEGKLRLIRCGVNADEIDAVPPERLETDGLRILYVGSLIEKKGVWHLLDALSHLPSDMDWTARIVGGGDLANDLARRAAYLGLADRVRFEGPQTAAHVAVHHRWAHVLVVPSVVGTAGRVEGIPVVLMEAMARGRAVIASDLSGIPELVEDGVTGWLVRPGDHEAIARALEGISGDWPKARRIALRGQDRIRAEYEVSRNAAELVAAMRGEAT